MLVIVVLSISVLLQLVAVWAAIRLMRTVGGRLVWITLSTAILLMSIRRMISLSKAIGDYPNPVNVLDAELVALLISALILSAIILIRPFIESIKQSEKKLGEQTQRNRIILETSPDGFVITDTDGIIQEANQAFYKMTGYNKGSILNNHIYDFIKHHAAPSQKNWLSKLPSQVEIRLEEKLINKNKAPFDIAVTAKYVEFEGDKFVYVFIRDISASKTAQLELAEEKRRAQVTLESIGDGVITTDIDGNIEYINPVAELLVGYVSDEVLGEPFIDIVKLLDDNSLEGTMNPIEDCLKNNKSYLLSDKVLIVTRGDENHFVEVMVSPLHNEEKIVMGSVIIIHNVTELKSLAENLSYQASHDALTGLVNRREFENRLENALSSATHHNREHALCYMDMDQFKLVNDTSGHIAGDELLRQLTKLLHGVVRETDTLARLGGDEFGILLESCSLEKAQRVVGSIFELISEYRFQWDNRVFEVGLSIGLVPITKDSGNLTDILSTADSACYVAKENGRNCMHMVEPNDSALLLRRGQMEWVQRLQQALEHNRFELYGQSIESLIDSKVSHVEILLRMIGEDNELISPGEFMPVAERYHMMSNVDRWVVKEVFRCLSETKNCPMHDANMIAINLSGQSIGEEEFLIYVLDLLKKYSVSGARICFEITETAIISNIMHARNFIQVLKNQGCKFALDDFGSGLSSFQYLKDLDVDYLKIDGSFIRSMHYNDNNYNMVVSINHIGHIMGLQTIAEFVETDEVRKMLRKIGVDYVQGYAIDKPFPVLNESKEQTTEKIA